MTAFPAGTATERPGDFKAGQRVETFAGMQGTVERVSTGRAGVNWVKVRWDNGHTGRVSTHVGNVRVVA